MDTYMDQLKAAALDPFSSAMARDGANPAIDAATGDDVANGAWWMCEGCCDPGADEFPEDPPARAIESRT